MAQITQTEILAEYLRRETAAGGLAHCDPQQIADDMARDLDIPRAAIREALVAGFSGALASG